MESLVAAAKLHLLAAAASSSRQQRVIDDHSTPAGPQPVSSRLSPVGLLVGRCHHRDQTF
eukprot:scaffold14091_cov121-Isochrysis_galbana.AAC.3